MSAFVVEHKTINRVVTFVNTDRESGHWIERRIVQHGIQTREQLGKAMFTLNVSAVNQRYGDGEASKFAPLDYSFSFEQCGRIQALKSLQCWLYQCSEGNVPESPLYQIMKDLEHDILIDIVHALPEYEKAAWA